MNTQSQIHMESMVTQQQPPSAQAAVTSTSNLQPTRRLVKRRARKACLSCRGRKVRCNAESHGMPCLNCSMDGVECVISRERRRSQRARSFSRIPRSTPATPPSSENGNYHDEENSISQNVFRASIDSKHAKAECGPQYDESSRDGECRPGDEEFSHLSNASLAHIFSRVCTQIDTTSKQGRFEKELVDYLTTSLEPPSHFNYPRGNPVVSSSHGSSHDTCGPKFSEASRPTIPNDEVNPSATERSTRPVDYQSYTKCEQVSRPTAQQLLRECSAIAEAASKAIEAAALLFSDAHGCEQVPQSCNCKCSCASSSNTDASEWSTSTHRYLSTRASELFTLDDLKQGDQTDRSLGPNDSSGLDVFSPAGAFLDGHNDNYAPMGLQQGSPDIYGSFGAMTDLGEDIEVSDYI